VTAAALALTATAVAQDDFTGKFVVRQGSTELVDGIWYVNAEFDLDLSPDAADMLRAPLPLTIRIEAEFLNRLRFWWDLAEFDGVRRFRLTYLPVRNRYLVRDLDSEASRSFISLREALDFAGHIERLAVVAESELDGDHRYDVRVRAVLDKGDLPGPLRLIAFWRKDWSIGSDWLTWRLDDK
jgi:hypothetical protein